MENKLFLEVAVNNQSPSLLIWSSWPFICFVLKWWLCSAWASVEGQTKSHGLVRNQLAVTRSQLMFFLLSCDLAKHLAQVNQMCLLVLICQYGMRLGLLGGQSSCAVYLWLVSHSINSLGHYCYPLLRLFVVGICGIMILFPVCHLSIVSFVSLWWEGAVVFENTIGSCIILL